MADINDNSEVDLAIQRVQMAIAESDLRATNSKLAKLAKATKSRTNYSARNNQTKAFKPNGVTAPSNFTYSIMPSAKTPSFRAGERGDSVRNPRANEYRAGERGQGVMKASSKSTSAPKASNAPYKAPNAPTAAQISAAKARSGASNVYTPNTAPKPKTKKTYVMPKATASQVEYGKLRGGTVGGSKPVKFSGIKPLTAAQKKAVADAKKKAGGR